MKTPEQLFKEIANIRSRIAKLREEIDRLRERLRCVNGILGS